MAAGSSQTEIINKAVVLLGSSETLSNIDAGTPSSNNLITLWKIARRSLLALHPWNHAIKRVKLTPETEVPAFGYSKQFALPDDCLRWLPWPTGDQYWFEGEHEGMFILANDSAIYIRYIVDVEEWAKWPALFVDLMSYQLAYEYCEGKTGLKGLRDRLMVDRDEALRLAKRADGLATGKRDRGTVQSRSRWAGARNHRNGYGAR